MSRLAPPAIQTLLPRRPGADGSVDLLLIAWRYLVARPITLVSTLSVTVGLMAIVVVDSVMSGFLGEQRALIRALAADVSIAVDELPPAESAKLLEELRARADVTSASPRAEAAAMHRGAGFPAMIGAPKIGNSYFVNLVGFESAELAGPLRHVLAPSLSAALPSGVAQFLGASTVARPEDPFWIDRGDPYWHARLDEAARHGPLRPILFGRHLAYQFGYRPGMVVTIATLGGKLTPGERPPVLSWEFVVVGTFATRDRSFDETHAIVPREQLVEFAALETPTQEIALWVTGEPAATRAELQRELASRGVKPGAIETWEDQRRLLLGAVESERRVMNVAMFFVVIVATFSLFVTLHQMVRRKTRDVGILAALGASPMHAGKLFLLCGMIVTLAGSLCGLVGGMALAHWLNPLLDLIENLTGWRLFDRQLFSFKSLPVLIETTRLLGYALGSVVCGTLFTLLPAWRAARLDAVEALRHD
ncbi:MAG: ABC transporter permease [Planctomycetes bacterium]|nr:ABC transporter permease [Planctomycetota bacterium]